MENSEEIKAAKEIIQAFLRARKILRLYPLNNPIFIRTLEDCFGRFQNYFHYSDDLSLKIRQNEIYCNSDLIYYNTEKEDNIALFFFKDGLREISFKKDLSIDEMVEFLKIMSMDFDRELIDDDVVTMLWEKDFQNIQYIVDESYLEEDEDYEARAITEAKEHTSEQDDLLRAYEDAFNKEEIKEISIFPLTDNDLLQLSTEFEKDLRDKSGKLADILFEMLFMPDSMVDYTEVSRFLTSTVEYAIKNGDLQTVTDVLTEVKRISNDKNIAEEIKIRMKKIVSFAGSDPMISMVGELIDSGQNIDERIFGDFVGLLDRNAIEPFMKILGEIQSIHARKIVIDALIVLGPRDIVTLARGLNDTRWFVVRNVIYIFRKIGDKRALDYLLKTIKHGDIRVRKEVIRSLGEFGGDTVLKTLRECLYGPEAQVRSAALKALGNIASEAAKRIIIDEILDKTFKDKNFDEKKEYFEVLSHWKDEDVFNLLVRILKKRMCWGRTKKYENKACAAHGLGLIGNKEALRVLNKYVTARNKLLRGFASAAAKRIEHGR